MGITLISIFNGAFGEASLVERVTPQLAAAGFPKEAAGAYQALAGFVLHQLGRVPAPADHFDWGRHRFDVVDMDRNRIDRVLVSTV